ncbi:MAG: TlpA disulfide reductase family protein [Anaerolineales bacterium]
MPKHPYFFSFILLLGLVWIWVSADPQGRATTQGNIPAPQVGFAAPEFTLTTLQGDSLTLSDLRGQAVLLNVWASWCPPCRAEMPAMQQVYAEYAERGFTVLAINLTAQDSRSAAAAFVAENGLTFPILLDESGSVANAYRAASLPTSFFIRPDGIIEEVIIGGPMAEALLRTRIERILPENQP